MTIRKRKQKVKNTILMILLSSIIFTVITLIINYTNQKVSGTLEISNLKKEIEDIESKIKKVAKNTTSIRKEYDQKTSRKIDINEIKAEIKALFNNLRFADVRLLRIKYDTLYTNLLHVELTVKSKKSTINDVLMTKGIAKIFTNKEILKVLKPINNHYKTQGNKIIFKYRLY